MLSSSLGLSGNVNAPMAFNDDRARLFTPLPFVKVNSSTSLKDLNGRPTIYLEAILSEINLIPDSPNRIPLPSILKSASESLICGRRKGMPMRFASIKYSVRPSLSFSLLRRAKINSRG